MTDNHINEIHNANYDNFIYIVNSAAKINEEATNMSGDKSTINQKYPQHSSLVFWMLMFATQMNHVVSLTDCARSEICQISFPAENNLFV